MNALIFGRHLWEALIACLDQAPMGAAFQEPVSSNYGGARVGKGDKKLAMGSFGGEEKRALEKGNDSLRLRREVISDSREKREKPLHFSE